MMFDNIFPYQNRKLGFQSVETSRDDRLSVKQIALITITNLEPNDTLTFPKGRVLITAIDDTRICYDFTRNDGSTVQQDVSSEQLKNSALCAGLEAIIPTLCPDYCDPMVLLIERDPSIFRLQSQQGWTVNDALAKCSGNVQYPLREPKEKSGSSPDAQDHQSGADVAKVTQPVTEPSGQGAFDF